MRILITGINSYLGLSLASALSSLGFSIYGTSRNGMQQVGVEKVFKYALGDEVDASMFEDVECVIHMAWSMSPQSYFENVNGTIALATASKLRGITKQIFISSLSAHPEGKSSYAVGKRNCDLFFGQEQLCIVRPGLVIGDGGSFRRICKAIVSMPIVPLVDSGCNPIQFVSHNHFNQAMKFIISNYTPGSEFNLFYSNSVTLKELLQDIAKYHKKNRIFVPVPSRIILPLVSALECLSIPSPISKEQILGYLSNSSFYFSKSTIPNIHEVQSFKEIMNEALLPS